MVWLLLFGSNLLQFLLFAVHSFANDKKKVKIAIEFASTHVQKQFHVVNVCCPGMRIEIHLMQ